jgi:hypothetical protein
MIERALAAVATGQDLHQSTLALSKADLWYDFFVAVAKVPNVHEATRKAFLSWWARVGWSIRSYTIKDDAVLLAGLRQLLPPYNGPPIDLWRGQLRDEPVGVSWTSSLLVARNSRSTAQGFSNYVTSAETSATQPLQQTSHGAA